MPRYFFNLRYGPDKLSVDPEGDELSDEPAAREHALFVAREMMKTASFAVRDWMACSLEVMDENERLVFRVPFTETVPIEA